eukprot:g33303.t1
MDYSSESVSFLDTRISSKDRHFSTSLYQKPTDNLMMLHFSSFYSKHVKETIHYIEALCLHRICSDEEEHNRHQKMLKDDPIRTGYDAELINRQFRHATAKNHNEFLRRQIQNTTRNTSAVKDIQPLIF